MEQAGWCEGIEHCPWSGVASKRLAARVEGRGISIQGNSN